ncbi:MAG: nitrile hydratase subunit beta [Gammaproteobacteria bacterium]|nr:nitrile hydratase subunit beta [Gammaproteobacteria bacterium]
MSEEDQHSERGYHDLGGTPAGPIDQSQGNLEPWEKRVDVLRALLADKKRRVLRADGLRSTVETMGEQYYTELSYYQKWMEAISRVVVRRGIVSEEQIMTRMKEVAERLNVELGPPPIPKERD